MQLIKPDDLATHFERKARQLGSCGQLAEANGYATAAVVLRFAPFLPTIEAEPVRHGRWEDVSMDTVCSVCGAKFNDEMYWIQGDFMYPKRCPECGAKMDAKEESHA